jgi:hypothetical protein
MQHANMQMIQAGNSFSFAFEALLTNGIRRELWGENLDSDAAIESRVPRAIYFAQPPAPSGATISYGPSLVPEEKAIRAGHYIPQKELLCGRFDDSRRVVGNSHNPIGEELHVTRAESRSAPNDPARYPAS